MKEGSWIGQYNSLVYISQGYLFAKTIALESILMQTLLSIADESADTPRLQCSQSHVRSRLKLLYHAGTRNRPKSN